MKKRLLAFVLIAGGAISTCQAGWDIYDDTTINSGVHSNVNVYLSPTVNIVGGTVTILTTYDTSVTNISGGNTDTAFLYDNTVLNLTGGDVTTVYTNGMEVNVYGTNLNASQYGSSLWISGIWEDGTSFNIMMPRTFVSEGNVILHEIPEPAAILLFITGTLLLKRKKSK